MEPKIFILRPFIDALGSAFARVNREQTSP
jgi:hypothetical protein